MNKVYVKNIRNIQVDFPFEPYGCQMDFMENVIDCLDKVCYVP